jgi:hypothetical protein
VLAEQRQFFRNEVNNNKETEALISVTSQSAARLRDDYNKLVETADELTNEVSKLLYRHQFLPNFFFSFSPSHVHPSPFCYCHHLLTLPPSPCLHS